MREFVPSLFSSFFELCVEQTKQMSIWLQHLLPLRHSRSLPLPPSLSLAHYHVPHTAQPSNLHTSFSRAVRPLVTAVVLGVDLAAEGGEDHAEESDFEKGRRIEAREQS